MTTETKQRYKIDLQRKEVRVSSKDGSFDYGQCFWKEFSDLQKSSSHDILQGIDRCLGTYWSNIPIERREIYAVARDELIELGIIEDLAE